MATATAASKKAEALLMLEAGENQTTVAKAIGVDRATVCRWDAKRKGRVPSASASANTNGSAPSASAAPSARPVVPEEIATLRARVRELEEECACLRKAVGYISRGAR